jgi:hypothetical protein
MRKLICIVLARDDRLADANAPADIILPSPGVDLAIGAAFTS